MKGYDLVVILEFLGRTNLMFCVLRRSGKVSFNPLQKLLLNQKLRQKSSGEHSFSHCLVHLNFQPNRSASILSNLRDKLTGKTPNTTNESGDQTGDDASSKLWASAIEEFEKAESSLASTDLSTTLSITEEKRLRKKAFLYAIQIYLQRHGKSRHGFNQFANNTLERMIEYDLANDLECYKAVISLFPVGRMQVQTFLQAEFGHFPRQQRTMIKLLQQMARYNVIPDDAVGQSIIDIFGWRNHAMQHYRHMMYWLPKLAHANPWPVEVKHIQTRLDTDPIQLARLIAERLCPDQYTLFQLVSSQLPSDDDLDKSADQQQKPSQLISAQSMHQKALLAYATQPSGDGFGQSRPQAVVYLDGPNYAWYRELQVAYYTLWTELPSSRLEKAKTTVERRPNVHFPPLPWTVDSNGFSSNHGPNELPNELQSPLFASPNTARDLIPQPSDSQPDSFQLTPNTLLPNMSRHKLSNLVSSTCNTTSVSRAQPEFDSRWLALRQSHSPSFLPNDLTCHEQAEGTIVGLGVVVPLPSALVNQKRLFDSVTSSRLAFNEAKALNNAEIDENQSYVPPGAPAQLLRDWLACFEKTNPGLANATLLIRSPMNHGETGGHLRDETDSEDERMSQKA